MTDRPTLIVPLDYRAREILKAIILGMVLSRVHSRWYMTESLGKNPAKHRVPDEEALGYLIDHSYIAQNNGGWRITEAGREHLRENHADMLRSAAACLKADWSSL